LRQVGKYGTDSQTEKLGAIHNGASLGEGGRPLLLLLSRTVLTWSCEGSSLSFRSFGLNML